MQNIHSSFPNRKIYSSCTCRKYSLLLHKKKVFTHSCKRRKSHSCTISNTVFPPPTWVENIHFSNMSTKYSLLLYNWKILTPPTWVDNIFTSCTNRKFSLLLHSDGLFSFTPHVVWWQYNHSKRWINKYVLVQVAADAPPMHTGAYVFTLDSRAYFQFLKASWTSP